jgi:hypothetical protein
LQLEKQTLTRNIKKKWERENSCLNLGIEARALIPILLDPKCSAMLAT